MAKGNSTSVSRRLRSRSRSRRSSKKKSSSSRGQTAAESKGQTAKITFTDTRTGKTTTSRAGVSSGGAGKSAPVRKAPVSPIVSTRVPVTTRVIGPTRPKTTRISPEPSRFIKRQQEQRRQEQRQKEFQEQQAKRQRQTKSTPKELIIEKEQRASEKILGKGRTKTGEVLGIFGNTKKQRQAASKKISGSDAAKLNFVIFTKLALGQIPNNHCQNHVGVLLFHKN